MTLLHELPDFNDLLAVVGDMRKIDPGLVEKDYWIWSEPHGSLIHSESPRVS